MIISDFPGNGNDSFIESEYLLFNSMCKRDVVSVQLSVTSIHSGTFWFCDQLTTASFPKCTYIGSYAFNGCANLVSLYLTGSMVVSLPNSYILGGTPIAGYSSVAGQYGSIYVPAKLLESYKTAQYWSTFSSRFVGI